MRLVEKTEAHVVVGLLLLLDLLLSGGSVSGGSGSTTGSGGSSAGTAGGNGSKLLGAGGDQLVDVLALKLGDELVEALGVSLDTDGLKDSLESVRSTS
jgi:hypothetical protein